MQSIRRIRCLPWLSAALLAGSCAAQVMQQPGTMPGQAGQRSSPGSAKPPEHSGSGAQVVTGASTAAASPADSSASKSPALPPSLSDKPAEPATITLDKGLLSIHADNSSLSAILHHLALTSGMAVDGFLEDQRVFGVYGPGNPTDVLSELLQGAGYNFLMVGTTDQGTPKEIVLTARSGGNAASGPAQAQAQEPPDEDDSDNSGSNNFPEEPPTPERPSPIPGASMTPPNSDGQVKTPAEIIQELQRLRQQQQNPQ